MSNLRHNTTTPPPDKSSNSYSKEVPELFERHLDELLRSAISLEVVRERGYRTITDRRELLELGFKSYQCRVPGWLVPLSPPDGSRTGYQYKSDDPRVNKEGKPIKYESPADSSPIADMPLRCRSDAGDPTKPLYVTEGSKKVDCLASKGLCGINISGVYSFKGKNKRGGVTLQNDFDYIALNSREVRLTFDSDIVTKREVHKALERFADHMQRRRAIVTCAVIPSSGNAKIGVDDYLAAGHTVEQLNALYRPIEDVPVEIPFKALVGGTESAKGDFRFTDLGNSERLIARHGKNIRFCYSRGQWLIWNGKVWEYDDRGKIYALAAETIRSEYGKAAEIVDKADREKLINHLQSSEREQRLNAMVSLAEKFPGMTVGISELNTNGDLLNVDNGTIDLRIGELRPHDRNDLITIIIPIVYSPTSQYPTWKSFLDKVLPQKELQEYVRRAIGYSLTGAVKEQCLFFQYGLGMNGKTTLINAITAVAGDYAAKIDMDDLAAKGRKQSGPKEALANLYGKRFVTANETQEGVRLNVSLVKDLTGEDSITADRKFEHQFTFKPVHKLWLYGNHRPVIPDQTLAIWRRVKLIPFAVTIKPEEKDGDLPEKLNKELPGILAWIVKGAVEWHKSGLQEPDIVTQATDSYKREQDILNDFLEDCCFLKSGATITKSALRQTYLDWCRENNTQEIGERTFKTRLTERGIQDGKTGGKRLWKGITLRGTETDPEEQEGQEGQEGQDLSESSHMEEMQGKYNGNAVPPVPSVPKNSGLQSDGPVDNIILFELGISKQEVSAIAEKRGNSAQLTSWETCRDIKKLLEHPESIRPDQWDGLRVWLEKHRDIKETI